MTTLRTLLNRSLGAGESAASVAEIAMMMRPIEEDSLPLPRAFARAMRSILEDECPVDHGADDAAETLIVKALGDAKWEYRTVEGIAAETGLDQTVVTDFLDSRNDLVWKSAVPDKKGRDLFTLKDRYSQSKEILRNLSTFMSKLSP